MNSPGIVLTSAPRVIFFDILKLWNWGNIRPASDVVGGYKHERYDDLPGRPYLPCWDYFWGAASGACIACRLDRGGVSHRLGEVDILRYRQLHTWWSGGGVKGHISWNGWMKQGKDAWTFICSCILEWIELYANITNAVYEIALQYFPSQIKDETSHHGPTLTWN